MTAEGARRGEFTQTVADHVLGNLDRHVAASIMNGDSVPHHLGKYHTGAAPCTNNFLFAFLIHRLNALKQFQLDERPLFQ